MHVNGYVPIRPKMPHCRTATPRYTEGIKHLTDTSPRALALHVYVCTFHRGYFQTELERTFAAHPELTSQERGTIFDLCMGTARWDFLLQKRINARLPKPERLPPEVHIALRLAAYELIVRERSPHGVIHSWVDIVKQLAKQFGNVANAVLRNLDTSAFTLSDPPPTTVDEQIAAHGYPAYIIKSFRRALTDPDLVNRAVTGMRTPAPTWVSVYSPTDEAAVREEFPVIERLPASGYPASLTVSVTEHLTRSHAFANGHLQPQNPASLELVRLVQSPAHHVLDLASGRGIKAAGFHRGGMPVTAVEIDDGQFAEAERLFARLGVNVTHIQADATRPIPGVTGQFPRVVLDAPCTGTGTLRSHPEIMFRLQKAHLLELVRIQEALLNNAASYVEPGGQLWYAVCSLTDEEGEAQAEQFVRNHPDFTPIAFTPSIAHMRREIGAYTVPEHGMDGFYYAGFERRS